MKHEELFLKNKISGKEMVKLVTDPHDQNIMIKLFKDLASTKEYLNKHFFKVNSKGQVEGGLKSFYETELKEINNFFNVNQE